MIRTFFRILHFDLTEAKGKIIEEDGRNQVAGGSGLCALLFSRYGHIDLPWDDPKQPLIFAIGPLSGLYPLMSKTVCGFLSSYHGQYTESHGGGRLALAMCFAGLDGIIITGKAKRLSCLHCSARSMGLTDVHFLRGRDANYTGKMIRKISPHSSGHRSILRIGPAGENLSSMACINVDTYRHFGRMGGGATMGAKNLKAIIIEGDEDIPLENSKTYLSVFNKVYQQVTATDMLKKYHNLGTAANVSTLNELRCLPWNNLQKTYDADIDTISGSTFAEQTLLRNGACGGCPLGCIHIGFIREKMQHEHRYHYHQVSYDYEPIFAAGSMLGVKNAFDVLRILDVMEAGCIDVMSGGVALAWATEASEKGLISKNETLVPLKFGDARQYITAAHHLCNASNEFYTLLGKGTLQAAEKYGGAEFACVLGQEMAGYATGELFFAAQSLGFRHSHLDTGAYGYDQKNTAKDVQAGVQFLLDDEPERAFLTSMVACLFSRTVYTGEQLSECLDAVGYGELAGNIADISENIRTLRWKTRIATGFSPEKITIPKRFYKIKTWKGKVDKTYLDDLKKAYGKAIMQLVEKV